MSTDFHTVLAGRIHTLTRQRHNASTRNARLRKRIAELERRVEILTEQCGLYQSLAISAAVENWNLKHGTEF